MDAALLLKWLHILSATILFGTGLGTAAHLWILIERETFRQSPSQQRIRCERTGGSH